MHLRVNGNKGLSGVAGDGICIKITNFTGNILNLPFGRLYLRVWTHQWDKLLHKSFSSSC